MFCLCSGCRVCLVVSILLLFVLVLFTLIYSVLTVRCDSKSKFRVYRHAAVASDAAPCSRIGKYASIYDFTCSTVEQCFIKGESPCTNSMDNATIIF